MRESATVTPSLGVYSLSFLTWVTRIVTVAKVVLSFRIFGGTLDGQMACAWRNVDKLIGEPRQSGRFFAKDPKDDRSKYPQEWIQCVRPNEVRRDRMSPSRLKGLRIEGELHKSNGGELRVIHFWNPEFRGHESAREMPNECQQNATIPNGKSKIAQRIKGKDSVADKEKWQNNRLTEEQNDHSPKSLEDKTPRMSPENEAWLQDYERGLKKYWPNWDTD